MNYISRNGYLIIKDGEEIQLPSTDGLPPSVHLFDSDSILAINAALAARRPLLVRGEPGTGKSQLARAAAVAMRRAFVAYTTNAATETHDLLWTVDHIARLAEAQIQGALVQQQCCNPEQVKEQLAITRFVTPGPLWWAFDWKSACIQAEQAQQLQCKPKQPEGWSEADGCVVLIDEIDKADSAIPNSLLEALGHRRFDAPGDQEISQTDGTPLIIITTNEERVLPDAFLRRCLVLHLDLPQEKDALIKHLIRYGQAHFGELELLRKAAETLAGDRLKLSSESARPGIAEYIDLLHAVTAQHATYEEQRELLGLIKQFALNKHGQLR